MTEKELKEAQRIVSRTISLWDILGSSYNKGRRDLFEPFKLDLLRLEGMFALDLEELKEEKLKKINGMKENPEKVCEWVASSIAQVTSPPKV